MFFLKRFVFCFLNPNLAFTSNIFRTRANYLRSSSRIADILQRYRSPVYPFYERSGRFALYNRRRSISPRPMRRPDAIRRCFASFTALIPPNTTAIRFIGSDRRNSILLSALFKRYSRTFFNVYEAFPSFPPVICSMQRDETSGMFDIFILTFSCLHCGAQREKAPRFRL